MLKKILKKKKIPPLIISEVKSLSFMKVKSHLYASSMLT